MERERMQIVDNETGEILNENEYAERRLVKAGAIDQDTYEILEMFLYYQEQFETFRFKLEKAMRENGIKQWNNDYFVATVKDGTVQTRVDTNKLKEDGLYEQYSKTVQVKPSLMIKFKDQRKA